MRERKVSGDGFLVVCVQEWDCVVAAAAAREAHGRPLGFKVFRDVGVSERERERKQTRQIIKKMVDFMVTIQGLVWRECESVFMHDEEGQLPFFFGNQIPLFYFIFF